MGEHFSKAGGGGQFTSGGGQFTSGGGQFTSGGGPRVQTRRTHARTSRAANVSHARTVCAPTCITRASRSDQTRSYEHDHMVYAHM
eukprot:7423796-Pyramimonas_sp.AAC.1